MTEAFFVDEPLGNLMRGARATLGKMDLKAIEDEIRIKAKFIDAIERVDVANLPSEAYLGGYVKSYAQYLQPYLGVDPDEAWRKFQRELGEKQGFPMPTQIERPADVVRASAAASAGARGRSLSPPRPITPEDREPLLRRIAPIATVSLALVVMSGLSYGAWSVIRISPVVDETEVRRVESREGLQGAASVARPSASAYEEGGVLVSVYEPPKLESKDGPLGDLDPSEAGAFVDRRPNRATAPISAAMRERALDGALGAQIDAARTVDPFGLEIEAEGATSGAQVASAAAQSHAAATATDASTETASAEAASAETAEAETPPPQTDAERAQAAAADGPALGLYAAAPVWVRVTDDDGDVVHTGVLKVGELVPLPIERGGLTLRTGNAGGTFVVLDGVAHGPLGGDSRVRTTPLSKTVVAATFDAAPEETRRAADAWARLR